EEPALDLLLLRPGVRKIDMEGADGAAGKALQEKLPVGPQDDGVGKPRAGDALTADAVIRKRPLEPQEIVSRVDARGRDEEPRLAAADLDLERRLAAEDRLRVERSSGPELFTVPIPHSRFRGSAGSRPPGIRRLGFGIPQSRRSAIAFANSLVPAVPPTSPVR